jgi:aspartate racemase
MNKIIIGILAGMGPKSTSPFLDLVIAECQKQYGAVNDIDFPPILIYSLPTPFFVNRSIDDKKMEQVICGGLKKLEKSGVDFIAMPCNSAHQYLGNLKKCVKIPILNMLEATATKFDGKNKRAVILANRTTNISLYEKELKEKGVEVVRKNDWQNEIDDLIRGIKAGLADKHLREIIERLTKDFRIEKITTIVGACTDLTKVLDKFKGFFVIDSSAALAEASVKKYLELIS